MDLRKAPGDNSGVSVNYKIQKHINYHLPQANSRDRSKGGSRQQEVRLKVGFT